METEFRRYFRNLLKVHGVWTVAVEHRSGGTAGAPDLLVQCRDALLPVELKVGWSEIPMSLVHSSRIRPAQIKLMDEALRAGIRARLIIGETDGDGNWCAWMFSDVRAERLRLWRKGFPRQDLAVVADGDRLVLPVGEW